MSVVEGKADIQIGGHWPSSLTYTESHKIDYSLTEDHHRVSKT